MNNATHTQQNPTLTNWTPKNEWIHTESGSELVGCHCVTPLDDCGCEDCQERHGYRAVYNKATETFDEIPLNNITGRLMVATQRNEIVYFQTDSDTTIAAVPLESQPYYEFLPRELSNDVFVVDGREYLRIYSFTK